MKVAMVSEHASPLAVLGGVDAGGQNVHVAELSRAMARRGVEVVVHTRRDDLVTPRLVELAPGVTVDQVPAGPPSALPKDELLSHMVEFAADLRQQWRRRRPDVVHAHFWMSGFAALRAARPLGIPVVQTFHALGVVKRRHQGAKDTSPPHRPGIERDLVRAVDRIVATCSDEVFELLRLGGERRRISVIPCGVDLELFRDDGLGQPRPAGRHRIVCVGRLVERKGIGNVVTALGLLRAAGGPDIELLVAGGPEAAALDTCAEAIRLRRLAADAGVADRVSLLGRVGRRELPALLRSADLVVCVPWYEPFGIVPLEAMACGVPVVASAVGGLVDTVVDGATGVHVRPRDPAGLAIVLERLLADRPGLRTLGAAAARRARNRYSWDRIAAMTLQSYGKLVPVGLVGSEVSS